MSLLRPLHGSGRKQSPNVKMQGERVSYWTNPEPKKEHLSTTGNKRGTLEFNGNDWKRPMSSSVRKRALMVHSRYCRVLLSCFSTSKLKNLQQVNTKELILRVL